MNQITLHREFIKFLITGVINTTITLGIIFLMYNFFGIHYVLSNAIGYALGFINSFLMNKFWTFKSKGGLIKQFFVFLKVFLVCYLFQLAFLYYFSEELLLEKNISQILSMIIYTIANFLFNKFLTFK